MVSAVPAHGHASYVQIRKQKYQLSCTKLSLYLFISTDRKAPAEQMYHTELQKVAQKGVGPGGSLCLRWAALLLRGSQRRRAPESTPSSRSSKRPAAFGLGLLALFFRHQLKTPTVSHPPLLTIRDISLHIPPSPLANILPPAFIWPREQQRCRLTVPMVGARIPTCARGTWEGNPKNTGGDREPRERWVSAALVWESAQTQTRLFPFLKSKGFVQRLLKCLFSEMGAV